MIRLTIVMLSFVLLLGGCAAVQEFGSSLKYNIRGEYYLQEKEYARGVQVFKEIVHNDPYNAEAHYYYGRFLLAEKKKREALKYLNKAVGLSPRDSNYNFWLGVAYGENGQTTKERESYKLALRYNPKNDQALTYLGNGLLGAKKYSEALWYYQRALEIEKYNPQALYNRAVILRKLGRLPEEENAWLHYLDAYPAGSFARLAADRLNNLGNQSYRNYELGLRTVTLAEIRFEPFTDKLDKKSLPSLDLVGAAVTNMTKGTLNILVYQLNNKELAKKRALSIRKYLVDKFPEFKSRKKIQLSWFDVPEKRTVLNKQFRLNESVQLFLTDL